MIKRVTLLLLVLSLSLFAQTINLKIVETTDVHGMIFTYDFTEQKEHNGSLAQVYTYLKQERAKKDQKVILLDNGDILQGTPVVYHYNFNKTGQKNVYAEVMNFMGYEAGTVGNHDIETGHKVYDKFRSELNFPWLAANAVRDDNGKPYFEPYKIINAQGVKVAVLGLITPHIPHWLPENIWSGMHFDDMIESAKYWVKVIKEKENPDLMIGLFHSGVDYTYGGGDKNTYKNENATQLVAEEVPGFDIVFSGHDHQVWNKIVKSKDGSEVILTGATSRARNVATVDVTLNKINGKWILKSKKAEIVSMGNLKPDEEFLKKFDYAYKETDKFVNEELGELLTDLDSKYALFGPSLFVDFINNVQMELTGADISFSAPLSFSSVLKAGKIKVGDMFKLYRYENLLYTMQLSGKEIKDYLEYTADKWFSKVDDEKDHLLKFEVNDKGKIVYSERNNSPKLVSRFYNFDAALGVDYYIDLKKEKGNRVKILGMSNGEKFNPEKVYKVAINSYRGNGGGGHLTAGIGLSREELNKRLIKSTDKDLRFYIMNWIKNKKIVKPERAYNWFVLPSGLWKKTENNDKTIMFK